MKIADYTRDHMQDTDGAILAAVNAATIEHENRDLVTIRTLAIRLGLATTTEAIGRLKTAAATNPLLDAMYLTLAAGGIDFAHEHTQSMIAHLQAAGVFTAELAAQLAAIGRWRTSMAEAELGRPATLADVTAARATIAREELEQEAARRMNNVHGAITNGTARDVAGLIAAFGA